MKRWGENTAIYQPRSMGRLPEARTDASLHPSEDPAHTSRTEGKRSCSLSRLVCGVSLGQPSMTDPRSGSALLDQAPLSPTVRAPCPPDPRTGAEGTGRSHLRVARALGQVPILLCPSICPSTCSPTCTPRWGADPGSLGHDPETHALRLVPSRRHLLPTLAPGGVFSCTYVYTHRGSSRSPAGPWRWAGPPKGDWAEATEEASQAAGRAPEFSATDTLRALCPRELSCDPTTTCFLCSHEDPSMNHLATPQLLSVLFKQPPSLLQVLSLRTFERQILDGKTSRLADPAHAG